VKAYKYPLGVKEKSRHSQIKKIKKFVTNRPTLKEGLKYIFQIERKNNKRKLNIRKKKQKK
jgi:hypothetical protein